MKNRLRVGLFLLVLFTGSFKSEGKGSEDRHTIPQVKVAARSWITSPAEGILFQEAAAPLDLSFSESALPKILLEADQTFQSIDGFGNCLTGGSAMLLKKMTKQARHELLLELFSPKGKGIGISYLRISIGASDLNDHVFSYDDLPEGLSDPELKRFSLGPDQLDLIPILLEILEINPAIKIMGSPWSAPVWMKTNGKSKGGSLKPECYEVYANYFVKYIQSMSRVGIPIDAITIQNEPLHPGNNPSMFMPAEEQARFIKSSLGPAFQRAKLTTKIIVYDHNADRPDYPISILSDSVASSYVDGSAFHLYGGSIEALSTVHQAFPKKNLYFTEQWVGAPGNLTEDLAWHVRTLIIGATRNWCRNVLEWNLASDPANNPHTDGGCTECLGTVTLDVNKVTRNPAYYILAHAAKFVRPGSIRIGSTASVTLPNVAFLTPEGKTVLIVQNNSGSRISFCFGERGHLGETSLAKGAVGTYVW